MDLAVRERSKVLFGNQYLLEVAARIGEGAVRLRAREIEEALMLGPSTVHRTLTALVRAGLLDRLPHQRGERERWYGRRANPFWATASHLLREVHRQGLGRVEATVGGGPDR